jgi:dimethylamine---corrinoid protein Co-methyltransferase
MAESGIPTRMGDGSLVHMTRSEIRADIEDGTTAAAKRARVPVLAQDELDHLLDIYASTVRFTAVEIGDGVVVGSDGSGTRHIGTRQHDQQTCEQLLGADIVELWHIDYSYKAIKTVLPFEQQELKDCLNLITSPVQYGGMVDLGRYTKPDGPVENWSELMPLGRIPEARLAQEEAVEKATRDVVFVGDGVADVGGDSLDLDTTGAAGDADFLAALRAVRILRDRHPDFGIMVGMANEFVLGMHGKLEYDGVRLAGLWPREQMKLAQKAGATVFGPAINVNSGKSCAWNAARAITLVKPCTDEAEIPIHMNVGMGVGAVPMCTYLPLDAVSRASKACVEILRLDGL